LFVVGCWLLVLKICDISSLVILSLRKIWRCAHEENQICCKEHNKKKPGVAPGLERERRDEDEKAVVSKN
jgi:hypothetical protein